MTPEKPVEDMALAELLTNQVDQESVESDQPVTLNNSDTA
jgi:hypothetical protein